MYTLTDKAYDRLKAEAQATLDVASDEEHAEAQGAMRILNLMSKFK